MMKLLRRHKDWLMIVIAILAIPFIFYFVRAPDYGAMGRGDVGQIYGRKLTQVEIDRNARLGGLTQALGMSDFWETLSLRQPSNAGYGNFAVNLIVLRHEAERLGLRPSASEIADVVRNLPAFHSESGFDINKFSDFVQHGLGPMGLGEEHIEQLVRDELCLNEIKRLLAAGVSIPKGELEENFQRGYDKLYVSVIRFRPADFEKDITVSDEDVQKYYDAHKAELKTEERRKVQFVQLGLTEEQKKLTGKERIEALQKLSDRATDLTQALLEKGANLKQAAEKFQLPVHETGEFTAAAPDPQLKTDPQLGAAPFKLSAQEPNSDPIQVADRFYILHLTGITEARPLTPEEAKPKIVDALKKSRARELMSTKGAELVQQLRQATKPGQPLEAATQKAGTKPEKLPPFSLIDEETAKSQGKEPKKDEPPDLAAIKDAVAFLSPGEISDFVPSGENGFIAVFEKREPFTDANAGEKKAAFEKRILDNKQRIVFYEWLRDRQQAAGLQFSKG
jgi:PPIC-type PPIASE domain/SurA N-terminal domain